MVRDLILDLPERDLSLIDKSLETELIFDTVWGNLFDEDEANDVLICNIIIPEAYWSVIKFVDGELTCCFQTSYYPDERNFNIRPIALKDGKYYLFGELGMDLGVSAFSYGLNKNIAAPIAASMLSLINIEGVYRVRILQNTTSQSLNKAYIYSAFKTDIEVNFSDDQSAQLLSLCLPGNYYRYPTTGIGITKYLNSVISHTDLTEILQTQFELDNRSLEEAEFDTDTGKLTIVCRPEEETEDTGLSGIDSLNLDFFERFTDDFIRRNVVLNEVDDLDFLSALSQYERILGILLFTDSKTSPVRIADQLQEGRFDEVGNIIPDDEYIVVSGTLESNSIIMFDDMLEDQIMGSPVFIVNDNDKTRLYTSLVEQIYWITENCHKCFVLKKRASVKYMIKRSQFQAGKGLFIIPQTSDNFKNMIGLCQDSITGRLIGVVSSNTNISDITLDEVTEHIYATQLTE